MTRPNRGSEPPKNLAFRILLSSLNPDVEAFRSHAGTDWHELPWEWLLDKARANKILEIFSARMDHHGFSKEVPATVRTIFQEVREHAARSTARSKTTLQQIASEFRNAEIPFFVVKGNVFSERVYGNPDLRPSFDLDIVVPYRFIEQADEVLLRIGYRLIRPRSRHIRFAPLRIQRSLKEGERLPEPLARKVYLKYHYHFPYVLPRDDERLPIDLHWKLTHSRVLKASEEALWGQTMPAEVGGIKLKVARPEASFIYLVTHAMQQGPLSSRIRHLCDVAWFLNRRGDDLEIALLEKLVGDWGANHHLQCAVQAARELFPFPIKEPEWSFHTRSERTLTCLKKAGIETLYWDRTEPSVKLGHATQCFVRQVFWDLALRRPPRSAVRRLAGLVARGLP